MKKIIVFLGCCLGLLAITSAQAVPNIVFILADDLGYGDVGFTGQSKIKTPHLDRMATQGAVMRQFYAGAPVCGPSRVSLMYGQHTGHAPIRGNPAWTASGEKPVMASDAPLLSKALQQAGYKTGLFGKWGLNEVITDPQTGDGLGHPLRQGFDEFVGFNTHMEAHYHWPDYVWDGYDKVDLSAGVVKGNWQRRETYADDLFTEKALDFMSRQAADDQPFFVFLSLVAPHKGYTVPEESRAPYNDLGWPSSEAFYRHYEMDANQHATYAGMISRMDMQVGDVLAKLEELGIAENTLVMFTSDNGPEWADDFFHSSGPFRGRKRSVTEGGIRTPTVVLWPGTVAADTVVDAPFAFWDLYPTFCELAGTSSVAPIDGISFVSILQGNEEDQEMHDSFYWEFNEKQGPLQAMRFESYKALRVWDWTTGALGEIQIYELSTDPGEMKDLASSRPELRRKAEVLFETARTENAEWPLKPHSRVKAPRQASQK
ncbi:arylsulfatase [Kiritimatiellota bacterium B12222]|nr:arylsulfatase [Kiritimatiellota bacterium B12222]